MALEMTTRFLEPVRGAIATIVSPVVFIAETPYLLSGEVGELVATHDSLLERNRDLERRVLELSHITQQYIALQAENDRMRELLGSRARLPADVLIAELVGVVPGANSHQVVIDKGSDAGVELGQAVIDAEGLVGQIVETSRYTSGVLLITDPTHAVPVEVNRNGTRSIAGGTGSADLLELEGVPVTADVREGDLLISSGLGGRFPRGYPVGRVDSAVVDPARAFAVVTVRPAATLDRMRHLLVIFAPQTDLTAEANIVDEPAAETEP
jgi:rod shape-determining protein MreC|tara:strand:+ start:2038 stop:2841 length:804 start_codon:yes stop_codon:yes gene_type:complete